MAKSEATMTSLIGTPKSKLKWRERIPSWVLWLWGIILALPLLSGLFFPFTPRVSAGALVKATKTQLSTFATALNMFKSDVGVYPSNLNALVMQPPGTNFGNWRQYMESIPQDLWGHPYVYVFPGQHQTNSYDLISVGPDGKPGTADDIVYQPRIEDRDFSNRTFR